MFTASCAQPSRPLIVPLPVPIRQVLISMPREVNPSHVKAARLRMSGVGWDTALRAAKAQNTGTARNSVRRILRELMSKADAEAEAGSIDSAVYFQAKRKDL